MNEPQTDKDIIELIRLKRYEQAEDGFFDGFFVEFKRRQAAEMQKKSVFSLVKESVADFFEGRKTMHWVAGAGLAYVAVMLSIQFFHSSGLRVNTGEVVAEQQRASSAQRPTLSVSAEISVSTELPQTLMPVGYEIAEYQAVDFDMGTDFESAPRRYF